MRPDDAEFGVTIDFARGESDPVQVFAAMTELLAAFVEIDRQLIGIVAPENKSITVIEGVEAASITTWIKTRLQKVDDQALKDFDWKKQIGAFAVKAKYRIINFLEDQEKKEKAQRLSQLRSDLEELVQQASPQIGLIPPTVDVIALTAPMNKVQAAKARLGNGESVTIRSDYAPDLKLNIQASSRVGTEQDEALAPGSVGDMDMILLIRKADLIGKSQWEFRHGKTTIRANIEDAEWLDRFHKGQEPIVPGSYMQATVSYRYDYTESGDLADCEYDISKVQSILPPSPQETKALFQDG